MEFEQMSNIVNFITLGIAHTGVSTPSIHRIRAKIFNTLAAEIEHETFDRDLIESVQRMAILLNEDAGKTKC